MAGGITITFTQGPDVVQRALRAKKVKILDFSAPFEVAGKNLLKFYSVDVIESQGSAVGLKWQALAERTVVARNKRHGYYKKAPIRTDKTLIWTGRLQRGFNKQVTKDMLRIFNTAEYFKHHQLGGGRVPQRKILVITKSVTDRVVRAVNAHAKKIIDEQSATP